MVDEEFSYNNLDEENASINDLLDEVIMNSVITLEELECVVAKLKLNKAVGIA